MAAVRSARRFASHPTRYMAEYTATRERHACIAGDRGVFSPMFSFCLNGRPATWVLGSTVGAAPGAFIDAETPWKRSAWSAWLYAWPMATVLARIMVRIIVVGFGEGRSVWVDWGSVWN